jgi:hypothetical protein
MCTEQLPPGGYPIAVKYIISFAAGPEGLSDDNVMFGSYQTVGYAILVSC